MNNKSYFIHSFFSGHVQGVGFRYQIASIAKGFDLTGYVKNLNDGRVELLAEGDIKEVLTFIDEVESELDTYIKDTEKHTGLRMRKCNSFSINA